MKRIFAIGIVLMIGIFGVFYLLDIFKLNQEDYEFTAFQRFLDENFFPVLNEAFKHFDQVADELEAQTFLDWYVNLDGLAENEELQVKIEELEKTIFDEEIKGSNTLTLKKNILEQISVLEETFELLNDAAQTNEVQSKELHQSFTTKVEELSILSEKMNSIIEANDQIEELGSFK